MASSAEQLRRSDIDLDQNLPKNMHLLKARQGLYKLAVRWQITQLLIVVLLPLLGAILGTFWLEYRSISAAISIVITILDVVVLDRQYRKSIKTAARGAEHFDTAVLKLPWNALSAGNELQPEEIAAAAEIWGRSSVKTPIKDWYPPIVRLVPLHIARVICQRANVSYDSALRRKYAKVLLAIVLAVAGGILAMGLYRSTTLADMVLTGLVPAAPLVIWSVRECFRQRDAAEANDVIQKESEALLHHVLAGGCDEHSCTAQSAQLQSALFNRRATNPLLFPGLYKLQRFVLEKRMGEGAEHWIKAAGYWPAKGGKIETSNPAAPEALQVPPSSPSIPK